MNKFWKNIAAATFAMTVTAGGMLLSGCSGVTAENGDGKLQVVVTNYALYDLACQTGGEYVDVYMILKPGAESHSYEPSPADMMELENCDIFFRVGGESETWAETMLSAVSKDDSREVVTLMDCVTALEEEALPGIAAEEEEEEEEYDEHIWTSPKNAILMATKMSEAYCEKDSAHQDQFNTIRNEYVTKLDELDQAFEKVVANAARKEIIFGDRFPFLYFVKDYGLTYYAAFPGCSSSTEASADTVSFLIDKVKEDDIPVVFHIELSNENLTNVICEATGAQNRQFTACHNVTQEDFDAGKTYIDFMYENVDALEEALN